MTSHIWVIIDYLMNKLNLLQMIRATKAKIFASHIGPQRIYQASKPVASKGIFLNKIVLCSWGKMVDGIMK